LITHTVPLPILYPTAACGSKKLKGIHDEKDHSLHIADLRTSCSGDFWRKHSRSW